MSDALNYFSSFSPDGVHIFACLSLIQPGDTVIYHVGALPRDCREPSNGYRLGEVAPSEIEKIVAAAHSVAQSGRCKLLASEITPSISVYYAVGQQPSS